jgi:hypothetical protein
MVVSSAERNGQMGMRIRARSAPSDEVYEESADPEYTKQAFKSLRDGDLVGEVISSNGVVRSRVWGPCPRCKHNLDDRQTHTAVTNVFSREWRYTPGTRSTDEDAATTGLTYYQVDVTCGCAQSHSGAPAAGRTGCGASFRVELEIQADSRDGRP